MKCQLRDASQGVSSLYLEAAGIAAAACSNPAILAYAAKLAPADKPDVGYARIFPGMTILKTLFTILNS